MIVEIVAVPSDDSDSTSKGHSRTHETRVTSEASCRDTISFILFAGQPLKCCIHDALDRLPRLIWMSGGMIQ
jgi:hypothetical protein